nr:MAG TPA: hypothetical protein [Caudoviricetes sp.]
MPIPQRSTSASDTWLTPPIFSSPSENLISTRPHLSKTAAGSEPPQPSPS